MAKPDTDPLIADTVPWADRMTEYDEQHLVTYLRLLDAEEDGADPAEMARIILGIEPNDEPERALASVESHLARARWMAEQGFLELLD